MDTGFFLRADGASSPPAFDRRVPLRFARGSGISWSGISWSGIPWSGIPWSGIPWSRIPWSRIVSDSTRWKIL